MRKSLALSARSVCLLNDCHFELLWDTGAQVSIILLQAIQQHLGTTDIRPLSELLDTSLNLTAVNGTKIPYSRWVEVILKSSPSSSDSNQEEMVVPVLVRSENLDCPILGHNVIEEVVSQDQNQMPTSFRVQARTSDCICEVKSGRKDVIIRNDKTVYVTCRVNTGPAERLTQAFFEPDTLAQWPEGLEVSETLLNIKPEEMPKVQVAVHNGTDHDIVPKNRTPLGVLQAVESVTAADLRLSKK